MQTRAVLAKQALAALLAARPGLTGVQVTYGYPGNDEVAAERIFMGRARGPHEPASLRGGRTYRNEDVDIEVVVEVRAPGQTNEEAEGRALVLGLEVEECVADNRTLGGVSGITAATVRGFTLDTYYSDAAVLTQLVYTVRYNARLT